MTGKVPIFSINLGPAFSAVAFVNEKSVPEIIPNREGERITSSVVLFGGDSPIVGEQNSETKAANSPPEK